ncbi:MAG: YcnI family protein, partial [Mycobacterium sp.]|nr:YcnI family protein [Mycobacterium sp.]
MPRATRWISRGLIPLAAATALYLGSAAGTPAAWAHVHASSDNPVRGATALVTFQVPNESNTAAPTTALTVTLPNVASASAEYLPGWTAILDRDAAAGTVRSVTWTAAPNAGIGVDQFGLFRISMQLPDSDTVSFPATQTYSDGTVVKWDQPPLPGGAEPGHPAPTLTLAAGPPAPH